MKYAADQHQVIPISSSSLAMYGSNGLYIDYKLLAVSQLRCLWSIMRIKLMKGKALRKHSLHEKTAASVLLKLFISGNE